MIRSLRLLLALTSCAALTAARAQMGGPRGGMMGGTPSGPNLAGSLARLFGEHSSFTANVDLQTRQSTNAEPMKVPSKIAFDHGKTRFDMDMSRATGGMMTPQMGTQMATMGMGTMVTISVPDKKVAYMVYPGLKAYLEDGMTDAEAAIKPALFKMESTELGPETVDGHPCVKNKVVVTDDKGAKHESTAWNATDLRNFPVKIESNEDGNLVTMLFKDLKLGSVDASQFDLPAGFTKYTDLMSMMQQEMMKRAMQTPGGN